MLLRLFASNLRKVPTKIPIGNQKCSNINTFPFSYLPSHNICYSAEKSVKPKSKSIQTKDELTSTDLLLLSKNPESFGTLSSSQNFDELQEPEIHPTDNVGIKKSFSESDPSNGEHEMALKKLVESGQINQAVKFFKGRMLTEDKITSPIHIYEWLIEKCLSCNRFDQAFIVYTEMKNRRVPVNFNIVEKMIIACSDVNESAKKMNNLKKFIENSEYEANELIYNVQIQFYVRSTDWKMALHLADEAKKKQISFDLETINALFKAYSYEKEKGFEHSLQLWYEMRERHLTPNTGTINAFLTCIYRCEIGDEKLLREIVNRECERINTSRNTNEPNKTNAFDDGRPDLFKKIPKFGHLLPINKIKTPEQRLLLIGGFSRIWKEIQIADVQLDTETCITLLNVIPNTLSAEDDLLRMLGNKPIMVDFDFLQRLLQKRCTRQDFEAAKVIDSKKCLK